MLIEATKQGRIFMVNYLLDSKTVDINETDKDGQTPLINACLLPDNMAATRRKLTRLFLSKNADVNLVDSLGRNPLMWACHLAKIDVVKILFGRSLMDLDFTCVDRAGNTALHYVSSTGHYTLTSMLVEAMKRFGVSLDKRNNDGMTPLLAATRNGKEMCAGVLLQNGASPDIVDPQTLMNVKELAENGKLVSLVEQITIRNPKTQSRCSFPRQPDDDELRSAIGGRKGLTIPTTCAKSPINQSVVGNIPARKKESRTPLLNERRLKGSKLELESGKYTPIRNLLEMETRNLSLAKSKDFSHVSTAKEYSSPPPHVRQTKSAHPRIGSKTGNNPYDLRDLTQVLSLYSDQQSATFRKSFSTPVMSVEAFEEYLEAMKPKPKYSSSRRSSRAPSIGLSPLLQQRRHSVLLKEYRLRRSSDPSHNHRKLAISSLRDRSNTCTPIVESRREVCREVCQEDRSFVRNNSDPLMDLRLKTCSNMRRHSLMAST